ncbi:DEAD/DEAH box helicase [Candidatus Saccharibacteria bacterium]|nr:DEAD/DEAH box helicase [Candidatus Saccharibacteria bacterium]
MPSTYKKTTNKRSAFGGRRRNYRTTPKHNKRRHGQYIDPARFVKTARPVEAESYEALHKFSDFAINDLLKQNLIAKGFESPSPIQDQTIPIALVGNDVIGIANTGTGKTAAFALPILHRLMDDRQARALIIAPTRELAQQIEAEMKSIAKGSGLFGVLLIGGANIGPQLRDLRMKPNVVIGTPGRIKDHLERRTLRLDSFKFVVLDEVDRMLDMGFLPDVTTIMQQLPTERQSLFFSATMDSKVQMLIEDFANSPVAIEHKTSDTSDNVHQNVVRISSQGEKIDKLHDILIREEVEKIIVFDETQRSVERLSNELVARGFKVDAIHGGKNQGQRQRALNRFKKSEVNILVATDVAARGIDVKDVTHVINYSIPQTYDDYTHRIGRAGRAGRIGYALTFINS